MVLGADKLAVILGPSFRRSFVVVVGTNVTFAFFDGGLLGFMSDDRSLDPSIETSSTTTLVDTVGGVGVPCSPLSLSSFRVDWLLLGAGGTLFGLELQGLESPGLESLCLEAGTLVPFDGDEPFLLMLSQSSFSQFVRYK